MAKFYSKTTNGFYSDDINTTMPPDAVAVSDSNYHDLFAAQSNGKVIQSDANGHPVALDHVKTNDEIQAELVNSARIALDQSDTTIIRCYSAGVPVPSTWQSYRDALRSIMNGSDTTSKTIPSKPAYPSGT